MKERLVRFAVHGAITLVLVAFVGILGVVAGVVPIAASSGHWAITEWFLHFAMQKSVGTHSIGIDAPPLDDPRLVLIGAGHYETGCRFCHGAPGQPMPVVPQHSTPKPPWLPPRTVQYDDAELFYVVKHGVKFTAMPAWPSRERDDEVWAVVAFLRALQELDEPGYRRLVFAEPPKPSEAPRIVVDRCARCHGVDGLGRGEGAFPRLAGQRPLYLRQSLEAYAKGARHSGIMRPLAVGLSSDDLEAIVAWYASRPPPPALSITSPPLGEALAKRGIPERRVPACMDCHGPGEKPVHAAYPRLSAQWPEYLALQLRLFVKGARGGAAYVELMKEVVDQHALEDAQIEAVAAYFASRAAAR